jgi:hypothetical protein
MSGSGLYRMISAPPFLLPFVAGQYNQAACLATACAGNHFPNVMGLITPEYASVIDYFKANFP